MLQRLPPLLRGLIATALLLVNIAACCGPLLLLAVIKRLLPQRLHARIDRLLNAIATAWIDGNRAWMRLTQPTHWDVQGIDELPHGGWTLVQANHQSWVDILVLQNLLNHRLPMLKFFLKHELIWVPVMGLAWWALDFPFMRRHSEAAVRANPALREQDRETTRRACEKFSLVPTSVMNFPEGTRFTAAKHRAQQSPWRHLLKPKAGALALSLNALGSRFDALIDITIVYPRGVPDFWRFLCGRVPEIVVRARRLEIPPDLCAGDYVGDAAFRTRVQDWLGTIWAEKDAQIDALLTAR